MAIVRATAVLTHGTATDPIDECRNVWHFKTFDAGEPTSASLTKIGNGVAGFYHGISQFLMNAFPRTGTPHRVEMAMVNPAGTGPDDDTVTELLAVMDFGATLSATSAVDLPREVAGCLSFRGDIEGVPEEQNGGLQRPRSRRRGRLYLGPLNASAMSTISPEGGMLSSAFRDAIITSYNAQLLPTIGGATAGDRAQHVVYSRQDAVARPVELIWVDNAPDTVRSRGINSTAVTADDVVQSTIP